MDTATFNKHATTIFGRKNESKFETYLKKKYKNSYKNLKENGKDTQEIDFLDDVRKRCYEFKSRSINHDKWDTALLNKCKIDRFLKDYRKKGYKFIVYFLYKDGLFSVEITKKLIKSFKPRKLYSYQEARSGGYAWVVDIPHTEMKFIRSLESYSKIVN